MGGRTFDLIAVLAFPVGRSKAAPSVVYPASAVEAPTAERSAMKQVEAGVRLAHSWVEGLKNGRWNTLAEVACAHGISTARISQLLPLGEISAVEAMRITPAAERGRPLGADAVIWAICGSSSR